MRRLVILLIATTPFVLCMRVADGQPSDTDPVIEYAKNASAIVIQLTSFSGNSGSSEIPLLRIYGDGRVLVYRAQRPEGQRYFEYRLSQEDLDHLLRFLHDHNAMRYEYGVVEKRVNEDAENRRATAKGDRIEHRSNGLPSDGTTTIVEVFLEKFKPAGTGHLPQANFYHKTGGRGITMAARALPEMKEAQDLDAVVRRLSDAIRDPRRQSLPAAAQPAEDAK